MVLRHQGVVLWGGGDASPDAADHVEYTPLKSTAPGWIVVPRSPQPLPTHERALAIATALGRESSVEIVEWPKEVFSPVKNCGSTFGKDVAKFNEKHGGCLATADTTFGTFFDFVLASNARTEAPAVFAQLTVLPLETILQSKLLRSRSRPAFYQQPGTRQNSYQLFCAEWRLGGGGEGNVNAAWKEYQKEHDGGTGDFGRRAAQNAVVRGFELVRWRRRLEMAPEDDFQNYRGGILFLKVGTPLLLFSESCQPPFEPLKVAMVAMSEGEREAITRHHYYVVQIRGPGIADLQFFRYEGWTRDVDFFYLKIGERASQKYVTGLHNSNDQACGGGRGLGINCAAFGNCHPRFRLQPMPELQATQARATALASPDAATTAATTTTAATAAAAAATTVSLVPDAIVIIGIDDGTVTCRSAAGLF
jgi:hypothetical protein